MGLTVALESGCSDRKRPPRLKIAAVISSMGPGGAERVMSVLANGWCESGHDVCLITFGGADVPEFYPLSKDVARDRLGVLQKSGNPASAVVNNVRRCRKLRAILRKRRPDIVVSFLTETNVLAVLAGMGLGMPVVVVEHISPEDHAVAAIWRAGRRCAYKRAAATVMLTRRSARWLEENIPAAKVHVIENPVSVNRSQQPDRVAQSLLRSGAGRKTVLALGRLEEQKGFDLLLSAFASTGAVGNNWRLIILGEGRERAALEALVETLKLSDRVALPGLSDSPHAIMESADLFVLSSRYEGMPMALLEAMTCGLACISFDCRTGPSEIITDGVDGILVPPGDADALSRAMKKLMADSELRAELGRHARAAERRYALSSVLGKWDALFQDLTRTRAMENRSGC